MNVKNLTWTVEKFYDLRTKIDPRPQYQRGPVWLPKDKQLLIDSILRAYDIPKIYLRKVDTRAYTYEVADGQQRLMAIWEFLDDQYPLPNDSSISGTAGVVFSDLPAGLSKRILTFQLVTAVAYNASSSEIRDLFVRLQRGVQLSQPEIRNALPSQLGDTVRTMAATHKFCLISPFSTHRYKADDLVAHAFLLELSGGRGDLKAPDLRRMYVENASGVDDALVKHVMEVLDSLHEMQVWKPKCISRKWGFVDVYWVVSELKRKGHEIDPKTLAERYIAFEKRRIPYVSQPEKLLQGRRTKADRELYDYIEAFKTSGGLSANVMTRHRVLAKFLTSKRG